MVINTELTNTMLNEVRKNLRLLKTLETLTSLILTFKSTSISEQDHELIKGLRSDIQTIMNSDSKTAVPMENLKRLLKISKKIESKGEESKEEKSEKEKEKKKKVCIINQE